MHLRLYMCVLGRSLSAFQTLLYAQARMSRCTYTCLFRSSFMLCVEALVPRIGAAVLHMASDSFSTYLQNTEVPVTWACLAPAPR